MKKIIVIATLLALPGLSFAKSPINHHEAISENQLISIKIVNFLMFFVVNYAKKIQNPSS